MTAHSEIPAAKQTTKSIREVLELLTKEFPDITVSKIRFLESRGLIHPERSASGYRKFGEEDVERLRWILRQQRENFLPLKVIKGRLEEAGATLFAQSLFESVSVESVTVTSSNRSDDPFDDDDFNQDPEGTPSSRDDAEELGSVQAAEVIASDADAADPGSEIPEKVGKRHPTGGGPREPRHPAARTPRHAARNVADRRSAEALAKTARVDVAFIDELEAFSLIESDGSGETRSYPEETGRIVELAARLRRYGIEPRHLRTFKHAAERESGVLAQVVMPMLQRRNPEAQQRAQSVLEELVEAAAQLHDAFVRASLREIDTR